MDDLALDWPPALIASTRLGISLRAVGRAHLLGVAGSGMRALAAVLLGRGWTVSGSDDDPQALAELDVAGLRITHDFDPGRCDLLVHTEAVACNRAEIALARAAGVPVVRYAQALGALTRESHGLAVAGTHGKSTVTAMTSNILQHAGLDPTVVCGATPLGASSGGRSGAGSHVLVEACEYRANFLTLSPRAAVILNLEADHFDCFPSHSELEEAFGQFASRIPADGWLLTPADCSRSRRAASRAVCRVETFAVSGKADWSASDLSHLRGNYRFLLHRAGEVLGDVQLQVPGRHNVANALAAAALATQAGASFRAVQAGLGAFEGLHRRLEIRSLGPAGWLVDDYAHHPTEVAASLATLAEIFPQRPLHVVFQPHQASRTARLLDEFASTLQNVRSLAVAEIFRAREGAWQPGEVSASTLADAIRARGTDVCSEHDLPTILDWVAERFRSGDVVVMMGAGNIGKVGHGFAQRLRFNRAA